MKKFSWIILVLITVSTARSQTLSELLKQAQSNYPLLKTKAFETQAGQANISAAKSSALPSLDAGYQVNYATYNNLIGMIAPSTLVPITGPPSSENTNNPVYGSAASLLMSWEPFTFGQRKSQIDVAKATAVFNRADELHEIFKHDIRVINTYLDLVMAHELMNVYEKNLARAQENAKVVRTLFNSGLRPGVDTSLFNAELSRARIDLLNYQRYKETQDAMLAELVGSTVSATYFFDSSYFHKLPINPDTTSVSHPLVALSTSKLAIQQQQRISLQRTAYPKLGVWGTAYARGSGVRYDGVVNSTEGLSFSRYNYGLGVQLNVPLLRFVGVRRQLQGQQALIHAQEEAVNQVKLQLQRENAVADVTITTALSIALESPVFFSSAAFSYRALLSRYHSGLANYADLVQAQYGLLKAETDLKKSYIDAWKALLYKAAVRGDLSLFLNQVN